MSEIKFDWAAYRIRIRAQALGYLDDLPDSYVLGDLEFFGNGHRDSYVELRNALVIDLVEGVQNGTLCPAEVIECLHDGYLTRPYDGDGVIGQPERGAE